MHVSLSLLVTYKVCKHLQSKIRDSYNICCENCYVVKCGVCGYNSGEFNDIIDVSALKI